MKYAPAIAGLLLGLLFIMSSVVFFFNLVQMPPPPEGSAAAMFFGAFGPTGYMKFVKVLELTGGILVAIPKTRNFGLLILGPILVNILAFHIFIMKGAGLFEPMIIGIVVLALYLLWAARRKFAGLATDPSPYEQRPRPRRHQERCVHSHFRREAGKVGGQRPALRGLGDVSPQGLAGEPGPHLCVADQQLVRAGHPALRRRRKNVGAAGWEAAAGV